MANPSLFAVLGRGVESGPIRGGQSGLSLWRCDHCGVPDKSGSVALGVSTSEIVANLKERSVSSSEPKVGIVK
jgi:hypothetical protein